MTNTHTHTHTEVPRFKGSELADCLETRCRQLGGLLRERRETLCSLEADLNQVSSVVPCEVEGASVVDGSTESLGGIEAPGALEVTRFPSMIVSVCVVSRCVFTSVAKCVLRSAHSGGERLCVRKTACVSEMARVDEIARVSEKVCDRDPVCGRSTACERGRVCE